MSRSIHTTRSTAARIARKKFASADEKSAALRKAGDELARKRRIKRQVADERRRPAPPLTGMDLKTIPIEVHDAGRYVHHSASIEDLRAILALLPPAATTGISSIKLILGKEFNEEEYLYKHEDRDPFTGRLSYESLPGVYSGVCAGTYTQGPGQITLHAHLYDPAKLPLKQRICELYLRLRALRTFVHEVAHHHDYINRVRRGRWLADRKGLVEWYAEKMEYEWTRRFVLPYLEKAHRAEVTEFLDFVEHQGGVRMPLEFFAGDSRSTLRNGIITFGFTGDGAFESWVADLQNIRDLAASRLAFALELRWVSKYEECLQALERVLSEQPDLIAALTCKGAVLHLVERHDEAFAIAERVLAADPANSDAWDTRGDVFISRREWLAVLDNCDRRDAALPADEGSQFEATLQRAVAYCGLGDMEKMEMWIEARANFGSRKRNAESIRKVVFRSAGKEMPK